MIFDAHSDIWSDVTVRSLRGETDIFRKYHYERLKEGGIEGSVFVIWIDPPYDKDPAARLKQIMDAIRKESSCCHDILRIVYNYEDMLKAKEDGIFYAFIGCEGLSEIGEDIEQIDMLYEFGARHASLTWNEQNPLATGIRGDENRGLTELGIKALHRIQELGMLSDVSHLNDKSFWDVMRHTVGAVSATHSSSRELCQAKRNLTDEMIKELAATGGMVGINSYPEFIAEEKSERTVDMLARHIEHIVNIAGIDQVGFGFDFCEFLEGEASTSCSLKEELQNKKDDEKETKNDDRTSILRGLRDASETPNLIKAMRKIGFTDADIRKISYENWHRVIRKNLHAESALGNLL